MSDLAFNSLVPVIDHSTSAAEQFLRCYLVPEALVMLPVAQLIEVLKVPVGQITPIPHLPAWVMGVYNWRGEILWMIDLGHLLGLTPWHQHSVSAYYTATILQTAQNAAGSEPQMLGLVVTQVQDIERCDPSQIQSPPSAAVTPELAPFLQGYWLKSSGEMLACLDGNAILAAMPKVKSES